MGNKEFKPCGEGENTCICQSEEECVYINPEMWTDEYECSICGEVDGHARGCPESIDPFDLLIKEGYD